jgi:NADH-quinone oxidoreductase subunit E
MLTDAERHEIEAELAHYDNNVEAVAIEAMKVVQHHRGWVSDEALQDLSELLGMSVHDLDSVATFYNLIYRRPVGRHVIHVCDSISCWLTGYPGLRDHLMDRLGVEYGGTTPDGKFTLLPIVCLGDCDNAPAMMIDKDMHRKLTPEKIDAILESYK